jgi:hypothetical protein
MVRALRAGLLLFLLPGLGCLESGIQECGDLVCVPGRVCNPYRGECVPPEQLLCGNGIVDHELGEVCDPARLGAGERCSTDCRSTMTCGNFIVDPGEACDCGASGVSMPNTVTPAECFWPDPNVAQRNNEDGGYCKSDCTLHCGDGVLSRDEDCDGDLGGSTCLDLADRSYEIGLLGCSEKCLFDTAQCRRIGWYRDDPGTRIRAVWLSPEGTVFAVGDGGAFLRRNPGGSWEPVPGAVISADLLDVWGTSDREIYAVGTGGTIVHFDGQRRSVTSAGNETLVAVWGGNVISTSGVLYRLDSIGSDPDEPSQTGVWNAAGVTTPPARDLVGIAEDDLYIVTTDGQLLHYDGQQVRAVNDRVQVQAAWGLGDELFVIDTSGRIHRRAGLTWVEQQTGVSAQLIGMWGSSASSVFAAGASGVVLHFDGTQWRRLMTAPISPLPSFTPQRFVNGSSSASEAVAVDSNEGTVWRYDGLDWSLFDGELGPGNVQGLWGSTGSALFAVIASGNPLAGHVWVYNDSSGVWSHDYDAGVPLFAIGGRSESDLYAVGAAGTVLRRSDASWTDLTGALEQAAVWNSSPAPDLAAFWVSDEGHVFVGGSGGNMAYHDPFTGQWSPMDTAIQDDVIALWGRGRDELYATSADGRIHRYDGATWELDYVNGTGAPALGGLWGNDQVLYAVGDAHIRDGVKHHTILRLALGQPGQPRGQWLAVDTGIQSSSAVTDLHAVWSDGRDQVFAAGKDGIALYLDGERWIPISLRTRLDLKAVWGNADRIFFGRENGAVLSLDRAALQAGSQP